MDSLKDFQKKNYDYISRYAVNYFAYNTNDNRYIYELGSQLDKTTVYVVHNVEQEDSLDKLANKYYGRPDLYWVIGYFNDIQDCFEDIYKNYKTLRIPSITSIQFK